MRGNITRRGRTSWQLRFDTAPINGKRSRRITTIKGSYQDARRRTWLNVSSKQSSFIGPRQKRAGGKSEPLMYVFTCMKAAGYRWDRQDADCAYGGATLNKTFFARCWN